MAKIEIDAAPFYIPNHVYAKVGDSRIPLTDLSAETLDEMAKDWLCAVYESAGKHNPWRRV